MNWQNDVSFEHDEFTFVRLNYSFREYGARGGGRGRSGRSIDPFYGGSGYGGAIIRGPGTDFPDSDDNFSFRLQQLTSLKVNPKPVVIKLDDPKLFDYPFVYMVDVGSLTLYPEEIVALRRYFDNGGFLMVDDFWGDREYAIFYQEIKKVFPDREPVELDLDHPIFHTVYDIKEKPQIPRIEIGIRSRTTGVTWEGGADTVTPHIQGIFDDNGRMMVIICHNTDLGDGWEREGIDEWYFREFSEKKAYPMGINIVVYALTH